MIAGYGYQPLHTVWWYLGVNIFFMFVYFFLNGAGGMHVVCTPLVLHNPHMSCMYALVGDWGALWDALAASMTAFHGRGLFSEPPNAVLFRFAAAEAVIGLFIEATFIATFVQRFIGK